jgi:mannitol/fructose-specific phosphotransferase system IIA component (Ntr-type)
MSMAASGTPGDALTLADFTSETLIIPELASRDMTGVIRELSSAFSSLGAGWDAALLNKAAFEREQQMTTAMPFGAAFPHVRSAACPRLQFAFGRSSKPFTWGAPGALSVNLVFLNAVPATEATGYLKLVSAMSRLGRETVMLQQFKSASSAPELFKLLSQIPVRK